MKLALDFAKTTKPLMGLCTWGGNRTRTPLTGTGF